MLRATGKGAGKNTNAAPEKGFAFRRKAGRIPANGSETIGAMQPGCKGESVATAIQTARNGPPPRKPARREKVRRPYGKPGTR